MIKRCSTDAVAKSSTGQIPTCFDAGDGVQLIYAVVHFGLPAVVQKNRFSLDYLMHSRRHGHEFLD